MSSTRIWCCGCDQDVNARFTDGAEVYGSDTPWANKKFYVCDGCDNYVGCHPGGAGKRDDIPLGVIPTPELRDARQHIHRLLDPLWKGGGRSRGRIYALVSKKLGKRYHTAREAYRVIQEVRDELS